jgi:thiamine biosynthesis lipoprotein
MALMTTIPVVPADAAPPSPATRARYLMGTVCEGIAYGDEAASALEASFDEIARLESILSDYLPDSEISRLNRQAAAGPTRCSPELFGLVAEASRLSRLTLGSFDITVAPLVEVWDLRGKGRLPDAASLHLARRRVGASLLLLDETRRTVAFRVDGMALDPGAIGKGYALDAAARVLRSRGVTVALLDFGGQVLALGAPPGAEAWEVDIAHPLRREEAALTLRLRDESASTSGNSQRHVTVAGRSLGHIVDPRSGVPSAWSGSATVIAASATQADAVSTAMLVLGSKAGSRVIEAMPGLSAVWLDTDRSGRLVIARGGRSRPDTAAGGMAAMIETHE